MFEQKIIRVDITTIIKYNELRDASNANNPIPISCQPSSYGEEKRKNQSRGCTKSR